MWPPTFFISVCALLIATAGAVRVAKGGVLNLTCDGATAVKSTAGPLTSFTAPHSAVKEGCVYYAADCYEFNFTEPCTYVLLGAIQDGTVQFSSLPSGGSRGEVVVSVIQPGALAASVGSWTALFVVLIIVSVALC